MEFGNYSEEVQKLIEDAFHFATDYKNRYLMPEHLLLAMTLNQTFAVMFERYGGNLKQLKKELLEYIKENGEHTEDENSMELTEDLQETFARAEVQAKVSGREEVDISHVFSAILSLEESYAVYYILKQEVNIIDLMGDLSRESLEREREEEDFDEDYEEEYSFTEEEGWTVTSRKKENKEDRWKQYVENISETAKDRNPLIGRQKELERTIQILCRMEKNNVLHVGEPGVGKTAIMYGLAQKIAKGQVPEELKSSSIYAMDMGTMIAGTQYRGEFEQRLKMVMKGLQREEHPILYLDEIHNIVGAGATGEGSLDMSNMLKPYLADGKIRFIGATTYEEYRKHIVKHKSLLRRFQKVDIAEPSEAEAVEILEGLKKRYEKYHGVKYAKAVPAYAVEMSKKYVNERFLPDKAIDLMDEAGAYRKLHPLEQKTQSVNKDLIDDMLALTCNVPKQRVEQNDIEKLAVLEKNLRQTVFGQDEAIVQVSNAIKFSRAGLNEENKPIASFLFVGPTGVGKTETAKALAKELGISFIRFDMSEYGEKHAVAKLIGAPAGYVGYEDGGLLTEEVRKHPHAVLLLDEIEKAHPDIFNVLLQVMDYATLTDNQGRKADFRNIIIIMTSNAGASGVGKNVIGFGGGTMDESAIKDAVKTTFQPEFRNRLSKIVLYKNMDDDMAYRITGKKLEQLQTMMRARKVELIISEEVKEYVKKKGITARYGAREIDRVIASSIKPLLVEELLFGKLKKGGVCKVKMEKEQLCIDCKKG